MWPGSDRPSPPPPAGRAVPSLGPFAELLGQPYQRLKVAVLRQLAGLPEPSWSLAEAGQALTWLEPATANRLLSELRSDGLVVEVDRYGQPDRPPAWRLSDEGHLVATVCAVLAAPAIAPERAVRVLAAAMALARAAGVDERSTFAPFVAATAVLERDLAELHRLIDQGDDDALTAAAEVAAAHLADLGEMARQVARPGGHEAERELAAAVAGRLHALVDEVRGDPARDPGERPGPRSRAHPRVRAAGAGRRHRPGGPGRPGRRPPPAAAGGRPGGGHRRPGRPRRPPGPARAGGGAAARADPAAGRVARGRARLRAAGRRRDHLAGRAGRDRPGQVGRRRDLGRGHGPHGRGGRGLVALGTGRRQQPGRRARPASPPRGGRPRRGRGDLLDGRARSRGRAGRRAPGRDRPHRRASDERQEVAT